MKIQPGQKKKKFALQKDKNEKKKIKLIVVSTHHILIKII